MVYSLLHSAMLIHSVYASTVRIPIQRSENLIATYLWVDGSPQSPIVDSGSSTTIFVWEEWYERAYSPKKCQQLLTGCYPSLPGIVYRSDRNRTIKLQSGGSLTVFDHNGAVLIGEDKFHLTFSLMCDKHCYPPDDDDEAHSLLGLAMSAGRNPTLIEQLFDTGRLKSPSFSLYLDPKWRSDKGFVGELTFGGMDSIRYIKPMEYALAAGEDRWKVQLDTITVGDSRLKVFGDVAFVDTGTNYLFVPAKHWEALTSAIWQGPDVKLTYFPKLDALFVSCRERSKLPDIALGIRGLKKTVYLSLSQEAYVAADPNGKCYLQFYRSPTEYWIFPDFVLVGNFLHFLPSGLSGHPSPVIGIAKLRSLPEPRLQGGALSV